MSAFKIKPRINTPPIVSNRVKQDPRAQVRPQRTVDRITNTLKQPMEPLETKQYLRVRGRFKVH